MIEQPLWHDDFYYHSMLQKRLKTPICLDESIRNRRDALAAIEMESCRIINIKLGRVGGFSEAIAVHNAAQERGIPVWCGGMLESGIGRSHNIALSTLENFTLPGDVSASARYWAEDIIEPEVTVSRGRDCRSRHARPRLRGAHGSGRAAHRAQGDDSRDGIGGIKGQGPPAQQQESLLTCSALLFRPRPRFCGHAPDCRVPLRAPPHQKDRCVWRPVGS